MRVWQDLELRLVQMANTKWVAGQLAQKFIRKCNIVEVNLSFKNSVSCADVKSVIELKHQDHSDNCYTISLSMRMMQSEC